MIELVSRASFIFGNNKELRAFARALGLHSELEDDFENLRWFLDNPLQFGDRLRGVVITRAERSVLIGTKSAVREIPVPHLDPQLVRDTNGAGDAFVGGFLAGLAVEDSLTDCVTAAVSVAQEVLNMSGCNLTKI